MNCLKSSYTVIEEKASFMQVFLSVLFIIPVTLALNFPADVRNIISRILFGCIYEVNDQRPADSVSVAII